jgi:hypothetical protein
MPGLRPFRLPFILPAASAAGTSSQTADGPPAGYVDNVSLAFPTAPLAATFVLTISGVACGAWNGPAPYGPFLLSNNEAISITATGLVPGTLYQGTWVGTRQSEDQVPPSTPISSPTTVQAYVPPPVIEGLLATVPNGTLSVTVAVPDTVETLILVTPYSPNATPTVIGNATGYSYPVIMVAGGYTWWAEVSSVVDPSIKITFANLGAGTWYVLSDNNPRITAVQSLSEGLLGIGAPGFGTELAARDVDLNLQALRVDASNNLKVAIAAGIASPLPVQYVAGGGTTGQTAVLVTQTAVSGNGAGRTGLSIHNLSAATQIIYLGATGVSTANGYALEPGHDITFGARQQWYAIAAAAGTTISWEDE